MQLVVYLQITLLQIVQWVCQCDNFESRFIFGKDMDNIPSGMFFETQCRSFELISETSLSPLIHWYYWYQKQQEKLGN